MTYSSAKLTILTSEVAVSPLLTPKLLRIAKALGYASVINAMPQRDDMINDGSSNHIATWVRDNRMEYRDVPAARPASSAHFLSVVSELPKPVLIFCQTGEHATGLWAAAMSGVLSNEVILDAAARAGHDVTAVIDDGSAQDRRAA